jgi:hypothetical protein
MAYELYYTAHFQNEQTKIVDLWTIYLQFVAVKLRSMQS